MMLRQIWRIGLICLLQACAAGKNVVSVNETLALQMADPNVINRYKATIITANAQITGIMVVKRMNGSWRGSLVNEFGIKMFDFISSADQCQVLNMIPMLDKWYIKKMIAADFHSLFAVDEQESKVFRQAQRRLEHDTLQITLRSRTIQRFPDKEIRLQNKKISYHFKKTEDETSR
jgi:hypothetical protein